MNSILVIIIWISAKGIFDKWFVLVIEFIWSDNDGMYSVILFVNCGTDLIRICDSGTESILEFITVPFLKNINLVVLLQKLFSSICHRFCRPSLAVMAVLGQICKVKVVVYRSLRELTSSETIIMTVFLCWPSNARFNLLVKLSMAKSWRQRKSCPLPSNASNRVASRALGRAVGAISIL